jgi:hypothetical protein
MVLAFRTLLYERAFSEWHWGQLVLSCLATGSSLCRFVSASQRFYAIIHETDDIRYKLKRARHPSMAYASSMTS